MSLDQPPDPTMPSTVRNERTKLTANWLNGVSLALFAAGGFGPWVALVNINGSHHEPVTLSLISLVCILVSVGLHLAARMFLAGMRS